MNGYLGFVNLCARFAIMYHYMTAYAISCVPTFFYSFINMSMNFSPVYSSHSFQNGSFCLVVRASDNVVNFERKSLKSGRLNLYSFTLLPFNTFIHLV